MLIHKKTMGVLCEVWTGQTKRGPDGQTVPIYRSARLTDFPELNPEEWWELADNHPLVWTIRNHYPWLRPILGPDGDLIDVMRLPTDEDLLPSEQDKTQEAARRGYKRKGKLRPLGMFQFLKVPHGNEEEKEEAESERSSGQKRSGRL